MRKREEFFCDGEWGRNGYCSKKGKDEFTTCIVTVYNTAKMGRAYYEHFI